MGCLTRQRDRTWIKESRVARAQPFELFPFVTRSVILIAIWYGDRADFMLSPKLMVGPLAPLTITYLGMGRSPSHVHARDTHRGFSC
ncbi:hypothetical protein VNO77_20010 [Canavalia gladiata]|uniref:Uncharacterized protein n=1 Tax=Canavalia gladiata TaxID=3824 RepID=A0AAN9QKX2_CANGL